MDFSSISGFNSIYQLVDQYMMIEQIPRDELLDQKSELNTKKSLFSQMDSLMSALKTKMSYLTDEVSNPFQAKNGSTSDAEKIGVTAGAAASVALLL